jgi:hypothetical protein
MVALELLAARRHGGAVEVVDRPDRREHREQAVDLIARDRVGEFAVEHTGLDSFPGQRDEGAWLQQELAPLEADLSGSLGAAGTFRLVVPHGALRGMPRRARALVVGRVRDWISTTAPTLQIGSPATVPAHSATAPAELGGVVLQRWPGPAGGRMVVSRVSPDELEALRQLVAAIALERKALKLEQARQGHRTNVLVLEVWDVVLANAGVVAAAIKEACGQFTGPLPDVIVQVDTTRTAWAPEVVWEREAV